MSLLKRWRILALTAIAVAVLGAVTACSGDDNASNTPTGSAAGSPTPTSSGPPSDAAPDASQNLTINTGAEPNTIDPQAQSYTYEATVVKNTYLTLFDQDPKTSQLIPLAAAEVPTTANGGISADNLTYTIKLRPDLKWSDGTPVTAADFVYGIIRGYNLNVSGQGYGGFFSSLKGASTALALDPTSATYVADVTAALKDSVVAVDDHTLKVLAEQPSVSFLSNFFLPITAAVKQSNVEALGDKFGQASGAAQMVTDGPFTVTDWVPKDHLTMTRSTTYTAGHPSYLKTVKVTFTEDTNQAYNALTAGQADEAAVPPSVYPNVKNDPTVAQETEFGTRWITVDVTLPPWDKPDFVTAINQATDRDSIVNDVYAGIRTPYTAPCAQAVLDCDPSIFNNLNYDLTKAKASALKAYPAGTTIPPITLETVDDPTTKALVTRLQQSWQQIPGVTVNINTVDQKTLRADMKGHISGTQITGWGMDFADPTDLWSIKTTAQVGANNLGFYSRPTYDDLEAKQDKEYDPAKRKDLLTQLQQYYAGDPADITFAVQLRTDQFGSKVKGIIKSPFDYQVVGDQFLADIYISK